MTERSKLDENCNIEESDDGEKPRNLYALIAEDACRLGHKTSEAEIAVWAESKDMGTEELAAIDAYQTFVMDKVVRLR